MHITGLYAALCALLTLVLAARVSMRRRAANVGLGDGNDAILARRRAAHGNLVEYAPLALLLLLVLELDHTLPWLLHAFGIVLVLSRIAHAWGISGSSGKSVGRMWGTVGTWLVMLVMSVLLLWGQVLVWIG